MRSGSGAGRLTGTMDTDVREVLTFDELADAWHVLAPEDRVEGFRLLPRAEAEDFFLVAAGARPGRAAPRAAGRGAALLDAAARRPTTPPTWSRRSRRRSAERCSRCSTSRPAARCGRCSPTPRTTAGGLMSPRYARVRPEMTVDEAISYLRKQARERLETIYYVYVLDEAQHLLGVVRFRELFAAPPGEAGARRDAHRRGHGPRRPGPGGGEPALPRAPATWRCRWSTPRGGMKGIVTVDDIVDVVQEEATEDIQKIGGMEALDAPYLDDRLPADDPEARRLARRCCSSARCSPPRPWATSRTRSPGRWCSRCSCRSSSRAAATPARRRRRWSSAPWRSARCGCATGGG